MTKRGIGSVFFGIWLGCFAATAAQLPPEIQVDRYLLRAERLMDAKDPEGALEVMGKIVALQKEHGLTLPDDFHFKHAKVAFSAGEVQEAVDAVHAYLLEAGREGKYYQEALELLDEAEQREQLQAWIGTDKTCAGQPKGASCWKELTGQPGCYVWDDYLITDQTVTWTGGCSGGRAQGEGTLKWVWEDGEKTSESTGSLTDGKSHGQWVLRFADGDVQEGPYVDGKKHGPWVSRLADGGVQEGPYVDGKRHGPWVLRLADGGVQEGPVVEGKKHGQWVLRLADGGVREGPYVDGKPHGPWVLRLADGRVQEGPYVDGKSHGQWVLRLADGGVQEGPYVDGKKQGQWVLRYPDGTVEYVTFEDGEEVRRSSRRQSQPRSGSAGGGGCQVPGYPNPPGGVSNLGFSWCPASVGLQVRSFALQAAGAECAIATGSSSTPEQIEARRREIQAACGQLAALGQGNCQCPAGSPDREISSAPGFEREAIDRAEKEARKARQEEQRRLDEQAKQAAKERKRRIEENNARVLASDCDCISKDERDGKLTCLDGFVGLTESLCNVRFRRR